MYNISLSISLSHSLSFRLYFLPSEDDNPEFDEPAKLSFRLVASEGDPT